MGLARCPECERMISRGAPACPHCGLRAIYRAGQQNRKLTDRFGMLMLAIPTACAALMWVCIYDAEGVSVVRALGAVSILTTGGLAAVEADLLRGTGTDAPTRIRRVEWAAFWFVAHLAAWILAYPSYLRWRSRYGARNLLKGATLVAAGFVASLLCGTLWSGSASDYVRDIFP
jgi:hypothetical protein